LLTVRQIIELVERGSCLTSVSLGRGEEGGAEEDEEAVVS
jgi:hypothetical protein